MFGRKSKSKGGLGGGRQSLSQAQRMPVGRGPLGAKGSRASSGKSLPNGVNPLPKAPYKSGGATGLPSHGVAKRPWYQRLIRFWVMAVGLWAVVGVVWEVGGFLNAPLKRILIEGNLTLTTEEVLSASGVQLGQSLSAISPYEVSLGINQMPLVATADATRIFPGVLYIRLEERAPAVQLRWTNGRLGLGDWDGVLLHLLPPGSAPSADFPLVDGLAGTPELGRVQNDPVVGASLQGLRAAQAMRLPQLGLVSSRLLEPSTLQFKWRNQNRVVLLPTQQMNEALAVWAANAPAIVQGRAKWQQIDLRQVPVGGAVLVR